MEIKKSKNVFIIVLVIITIIAFSGLIVMGVNHFTATENSMLAHEETENLNIVRSNNIVIGNTQPEEEPLELLQSNRENNTVQSERQNVQEIEQANNDNPIVVANGRRTNTAARIRQYYQGFVRVGTIRIPRTGINYPILERGTERSLDTALAVMWPENPEQRLNNPGNVVIMGHNYRDGRFFSNNFMLREGDRIYVTDNSGRTIAYEVYEIFETTPEDTSYITRNTNGQTEITLTTCTDDAVRRTIIQARAVN